MNQSSSIAHQCSICNRREEDSLSVIPCASCLKGVCSNCAKYESPIPFMGIPQRKRICKRCVLCYSNCDSKWIENYRYCPSFVDFSKPCYSLYAESRCCSSIYHHRLHDLEVVSSPQNQRVEMTPLWVPDCLSDSCSRCNRSFSLFRRRHHCRICGKIYCNACCSNRIDLSDFGYPLQQCKSQRVCEECKLYVNKRSDSFNDQSLQVKVIVCSFLGPRDVHSLSLVNKRMHRQCTSMDFDRFYWQYLCKSETESIYSILSQPQLELYNRLPDASDENEGCFWQCQYLTGFVIPNSVACSLTLLSYPLTEIRLAAMKQIHSESCHNPGIIQSELEKKEGMQLFIKCLQYCNSDIKRKNTLCSETQQFLLSTAGSLLNATPTSPHIASSFRENGGITTILSLLQNDCFQMRSNLSPSDNSSGHLLRSSSRSPRSTTNLTRKIMTYLTGILMNISKLDTLSCQEIGQLNGIPILVSFLQYSQDLLNVHCLECLRVSCKSSDYCKNVVGDCGGIIKVINCYNSSCSQVVTAAVNATNVILINHPGNTRLFCLANGLNSLIQIEEKWKGKRGICAAKCISNILSNSVVVSEFLQQRGLERMNTLLCHRREEIHGILLGQLMNCFMYSPSPVIIQSSLLASVIYLVKKYIQLGEVNETGSIDLRSSTELSVSESSLLNSSQDVLHNSEVMLIPSPPVEDEKQRSVSTSIPLVLGYGAGFFYSALKNKDNCQLCLDYGIEELLSAMEPYCDYQGSRFILLAREIIQKSIDGGSCVYRGTIEPDDLTSLSSSRPSDEMIPSLPSI